MAYPTKPTVARPEWATDVAAIITEPPLTKKESGWEYLPSTTKGEKPVMDYENWFKNSTYTWVLWAESALDDHETRLVTIESDSGIPPILKIKLFSGLF